MAISLPSNISKRTILVLLILFIGFIALGIYGWSRSFKDIGASGAYQESVMRTVQMITSKRPLIVSEIYPRHWTVLISFFGIKAVLLYTVFYSVFFLLRRQLAVWIWNLKKVNGHTVIIGINEESKSLIEQFLTKDLKIVVIEENKENPDIKNLEDQGVLVVLGNPEEDAVLKKSRLINADKVLVVTDDQSNNINFAESISKFTFGSNESNEIDVLVRVKSEKLRGVLEKRWKVIESKKCIFRIINFQSTALREIISEITIDLCGDEKFKEQGPRFLIIADSSLNDDLLKQAIQFVQISGESVPSFTITTKDPEDRGYFRSKYPDIDLVAKVEFIDSPKNRVADAQMFADQSFDVLIVSLENELDTIGLTYEMLDSSSINIVKGYALLRESQKIDMNHHERLRIMSLSEYGKKSPEFGDFDMEKEAEDNHNAYLAGLSEEKRLGAKTWEQLEYAAKEANRLAVLHRKVKLKLKETRGDQSVEELISSLACSEHQRWKAEKILSGWRSGTKRDDERKVHDNICSYSELTDEIKGYDVTQVKEALGLD
ncbi:MAG: hypothetical protein CMO69_07590 [Verrucomicrobiales bacterium]|nr:hypothetical protein [Verrucomicrobiales bacterium]